MHKVSKTFASHKIDDSTLNEVNAIRVAFTNMEDYLGGMLPNGRLKLIAMTQLEIASGLAIKAACHDDTNSVPDLEVDVQGLPLLVLEYPDKE